MSEPAKMRGPAPALSVPVLGGGVWTLAERRPGSFTMIVFYRGVHCPICRLYLKEVQDRLDAFAELGVEVIAVSVDTQARAAHARIEWELDRLTIGYGMSIDTARSWGLYISTALNDGQLPLFGEPGLFLVEPTGALYYAAVSSAPWGRPPLDWVVGGIKRSIELKVPARGDA